MNKNENKCNNNNERNALKSEVERFRSRGSEVEVQKHNRILSDLQTLKP